MVAPPACQILTTAQVTAALDGGPPRMVAATQASCQWWLTDGVTYLTLEYVSFESVSAARAGFSADQARETNAAYSTSTRPESGIGENAFSAFYSNYRGGFGRELLIFLKDTYVVTINLVARGGDAVLRMRVESLARAAVAKV